MAFSSGSMSNVIFPPMMFMKNSVMPIMEVLMAAGTSSTIMVKRMLNQVSAVENSDINRMKSNELCISSPTEKVINQ